MPFYKGSVDGIYYFFGECIYGNIHDVDAFVGGEKIDCTGC